MSTRILIVEVGVETYHNGAQVVDEASVELGRLAAHITPLRRKVVESILGDAGESLSRELRREARRA